MASTATMTSAIVALLLVGLAASGVAQVAPDGRALFNTGGSNLRMFKAINGSEDHFYEVLKNLMVPRVVGTPSHQKVKQFIISEMRRLGWQVETDPFNSQTPIFGNLRFENILAKINPSAKQTLVLACHYDSKYFPNFEFIGATDSAVPCAMLINLAHSLRNDLSALQRNNVGLELWFLDGEEAFQKWGPTDSIYGARHLAAKMEGENTLRKIKLLVLLDLLGTPGPYFYNYYSSSNSAYRTLASGERALRNFQHLKALGRSNDGRESPGSYFRDRSVNHFVEDDHIPFLQRGVPVLHMIPHRFPEVWHTQYDNWDALDRPTIEDLNKVIRMFVLNYLHL